MRNFYNLLLSGHPLLSGHLGRSRKCPLNRGFTLFYSIRNQYLTGSISRVKGSRFEECWFFTLSRYTIINEARVKRFDENHPPQYLSNKKCCQFQAACDSFGLTNEATSKVVNVSLKNMATDWFPGLYRWVKHRITQEVDLCSSKSFLGCKFCFRNKIVNWSLYIFYLFRSLQYLQQNCLPCKGHFSD